MTKRRIIFFAIFGTYQLLLVFFTMYMESQRDNFKFLGAMLKNFSLFKYGALIGLILLIVDLIWSWRVNREQQKEYNSLLHETNTLKAKVYDLQEASKGSGISNIK